MNDERCDVDANGCARCRSAPEENGAKLLGGVAPLSRQQNCFQTNEESKPRPASCSKSAGRASPIAFGGETT